MVVQVALSLVLLAAAGLFLSTFRRLATLPLGFEAARIWWSTSTRRGPTRSGVTHWLLPATRRSGQDSARRCRGRGFDDHPVQSGDEVPLFADVNRVHEHVVSPGFFATYGVPMQSGRDFDNGDSSGSRALRSSASPMSRSSCGIGPARSDARLRSMPAPRGPCAVVGVVGDAVFGPLRSGPRPTIYFPLAQPADAGPPGRTVIALSVRPQPSGPRCSQQPLLMR